MLPREVVVIEVGQLDGVHVAHVNNGHLGVVELSRGGHATDNGDAVFGNEDTDGQEIVFVGAPGMREDGMDHDSLIARWATGLQTTRHPLRFSQLRSVARYRLPLIRPPPSPRAARFPTARLTAT